MSYILGGVTLPQPKQLRRKQVEISVEHLLVRGKTTKRTTRRKEQYTLVYQMLTVAQVNAILAIFELEEVVSFEISETNMQIGPTDVLVDMSTREYVKAGLNVLENFNVILTEVN